MRDLKRLLSGPTGKTVLTTVQKFQEIEGRGKAKGRRSQEEYPLLSEAKNIFVLADEAHRTQYGGLAANLRRALPNACFFGFTGTPIDKQDRSTLQTFGGYIDTYTIERARLWASRLGIDAPRVLIREPRKHWGSCDAKGTLRLNWRVIQAPLRLVDYVVAHELCHLEHPDHTRAFWATIGRVMPDYDVRRDALRELGGALAW